MRLKTMEKVHTMPAYVSRESRSYLSELWKEDQLERIECSARRLSSSSRPYHEFEAFPGFNSNLYVGQNLYLKTDCL